MADFPQFQGADGTLRQDFILSTTVPYRFFSGDMPADTVDMQVSIRGGAFTSDPDFITFEGTHFTVPNPSAFPDGLQLLPGQNDIRVKAVLSSGTTTQEARVNATLVLEADVSSIAEAPSGVVVERLDSTVRVTVDGLEGDAGETVVGYHFYASPNPGGGAAGYFRINPRLILSGESVEVEEALANLTADATVPLDDEGFPIADPLFFRLQGSQENNLESTVSSDFDEVLEVPETASRLRVASSISTVRQVQRFSFEHDRQGDLTSEVPALPHSTLAVVPDSDPLYYVITAVHVIDGVEVESHFSPEVAASPLRISPQVGAFPQVARQDIVRSMVESIYRSNPAVRVDPGSALRDTVIDPFSTEADRIRFIIDFLHNSQSFATLLLIDDPNLVGESIPVGQSAYKVALREAFFLPSDDAVQEVIDSAFDKLASNYGVIRDGGKRARGEVTFFVNGRPTTSITKALGTLVTGGGFNFRTTSTAIILPTGGGRNFNPATGRYFARAFVQAETAGSGANLSSGQIRTIPNNTLNVQVVNESPMFGGTDRESNRDLALRAQRVLSSVDSGTLQGYTDNALRTPGVLQVSVVQADSPLMMRDRSPESGRHVGGKVDVYLRGDSEARVTDTFAFQFNTRERQQFEPVGDLTNLRFRAVDPALSVDNPLIEMLDLPSLDLQFENATKGYAFDLTNVQVVGYNLIELDPDYNDPIEHDLDDEIRGSYRYRTSDRFVLTRQPVIEVESFVGTQTGEVDSALYSLFRASDPLELGRSTEAGDFVRVTETLDDDGTVVPSAQPVVVTGEEHTMLDGIEYLNNLGVNQLTVRVWNTERTVEYNGPLSNDARDFTFVVPGDETTAFGIQLTEGSRIVEGQTVLVDYSHDENFTVTYTSNAVVSVVQENINNDSHITADAIAKWAVEVTVDITATIVLQPNQTQAAVDSRVRTALARLFGTFGLGTPVRQSDVIRALDAVQGVSYVVTPLTKMVRGADSLVVREPVSTDTDSDFTLIGAWSSPTVNIYLLRNPLSTATTNAGGSVNQFRGVFQDEQRLLHEETPPNINGFPMRGGSGRAFIIGADGINIPGYSDNATIEASYVLPSDPDEKEAEVLRLRKVLTANRVLVSLVPGGDPEDSPLLHDYTVTYVVGADTGTKNIEPGPIEYLVLGDLNFTYDEVT